MPSCLVEALYMTNPTDLALIMDPAVREKIALAVYEGLWEFFLTP
jgi:N-acetylmuramoyl-L-alanine amidase